MNQQHQSILSLLASSFRAAIAETTGKSPEEVNAMIRPAGDPKFGDYQCNVAMSLAKELRAKPREVAERVIAAVQPRLADLIEPLEIAGPGFINIRLKPAALAAYLSEIPRPPEAAPAAAPSHFPTFPLSHLFADRLGIAPVATPQRIVVEYSQPNIAKQMHVGHLRSTIIGDVFARVLAFEGHDVIRQNHIGDWGTQFGMLIRWYREHPLPTPQTHADVLEAIGEDYRAAQKRFEEDTQFADEARRAVAELQSGDLAARQMWQQMCQVSLQAMSAMYDRLGVLLRPEDVRGESFYNDRLAGVVTELREKLPPRDVAPAPRGRRDEPDASDAHGEPALPWAEVRDDQGAVCVFVWNEKGEPRFKSPEGQPLPLIIQKSDGAYLYATTDLAAIRFRLRDLRFSSGTGAERVIYVTDARQRLHFEMFLAVARAAGWVEPHHRIDHVTFGSVLGEDRRPLKTRAGGTVKLRELLDEAESRALALVEERARAAQTEPPDAQADDPFSGQAAQAGRAEIARRVGIGAVKYADLRNDRRTDYIFSWDKMLALTGNTAPYMMYAYARIRSIYRKAAERIGSPDVYAPEVRLTLVEPAELALGLRLARLRETIDVIAADLEPHVLCTYLYELAGDFMRFYETCPVLQAPDEATRLSRLRLCDLTARTLRLGLSLLGIETIERM
jgi:arginyl-tRNA synthetase